MRTVRRGGETKLLEPIGIPLELPERIPWYLPAHPPPPPPPRLMSQEKKLVCVTSGNSYFGKCLVKHLIRNGNVVRITTGNPEVLEDMKCDEELRAVESVVVAQMQDVESLREAFTNCHAVFHTSSFIDPRGISGYTERMALLEAEAASNVVQACASSTSGRRCIFTSSLLSSVWGTTSRCQVLNERHWSNERFCRENKLWLALGKTMSEKAAWRKSVETKVKLVALCPGLITGPHAPGSLQSTARAYLKGAQLMLQRGVLATVDVNNAARAHVKVYEELDRGADGRYLCYDRIISRPEEAQELERSLCVREARSTLEEAEEGTQSVILANEKLARLMCGRSRCLRWA